MHLNLAIKTNYFAKELARETVAGGLTIVDAIERLLGQHLEDSVSKSLGSRLIKAPRAVVHPRYYLNRFENLSNLCQRGYYTWYPEVRFATRKGDTLAITQVESAGFDFGYIKYGGSVDREYMYSIKELKTQVNHTVRLNKLSIPAEVFSLVIRIVEQSTTIEQPYIANLTVGFKSYVDDRIEGYRIVSFDHVVTGERRFCRCHSDAHAVMFADAKKRAPSYVPDSWPHHVISLLEHATYSDALCHFCVAEQLGEDALSDWYGDQIQQYYDPYVDLLVRSTDMDSQTAKSEAKRRLSISRWVREDELYRLVTRLFPTKMIRREASPQWLGQQRLDIYLPELALAIEHQGEQHYRPIKAFGGEQAFVKTQERDERKRTLCQENGVTVVDIRFDDALTFASLRSRLRRWLPK